MQGGGNGNAQQGGGNGNGNAQQGGGNGNAQHGGGGANGNGNAQQGGGGGRNPQVDNDVWLKGILGLTAAIIATMSFQLATNPPGGVLQASLSEKALCSYQGTYVAIFNTISFIASLGVCLLSVIYIKNHKVKDPIRILSIGLYITITSLVLTFLFAAWPASTVTTTSIWPSVLIVVVVPFYHFAYKHLMGV